ncbi:MAG: hypothetical protein ACRDTD_02190, partial [Pseudonocardiaceae bacterium]
MTSFNSRGCDADRPARLADYDTSADRGLGGACKASGATRVAGSELVLPVPVDELVNRPSVGELLDRAVRRRICVVIGAAGWGKTTAVAAWSRSRLTAWLRYEDHEGDADRLLASLFGALRAHASVPAPTLGAVALDEV